MSVIAGRTPTHHTEVTHVRELTPRMRRITLAGPSLAGLYTRPAQDVELILTESSGRRVKRRYTIRAARPDRGEIDLDVLLHGHGPGSSWGAGATAGTSATLLGPRGKLDLRPADWHLFVGDESALPAFAALSEALPSGEPALAIIEADGPDDEIPLTADVQWLHRGAGPAGTAPATAEALRRLKLPAGSGRAYLLGESRAVVALRPVVQELGVAADHVFVKGYWNVGRGSRAVPGSNP